MAKISTLIAFLAHLLCAMTQRQPSPCSEYFTYMTKPGITDMFGQIEIPSPSENDTFFLKVAFDTTGWPSELVRLEMAQSIKASVGRVRQGRSLLYHVYYPSHEPTPSLSAIWFNYRRYCPGPEVTGNITANVELGHILYPPNEEPLVYSDGPWQHISQQWHRNISHYRIANPSYDHLNNDECGITRYYTDDTNRLISNREKSLPGQWPWLVAIYIQRPDNESVYDFECAGSLLSTKHVITDMVCIQKKRFDDPYARWYEDPQRVHVSFGQFKSREWHGNHIGIINRVIEEYKLIEHTDNLMSHSLVILILKTAVEFNAFIRPVCLWSDFTNFQDINTTGYIVGWGFKSNKCTEFVSCSPNKRHELYTEEPRTIKVPLTNISKNPLTRGHLNVRTLQFGYDLPCDIGGGLVVFNIITGRYQLLGVAAYCSTSYEIIYTDVAEYVSWIREKINII